MMAVSDGWWKMSIRFKNLIIKFIDSGSYVKFLKYRRISWGLRKTPYDRQVLKVDSLNV